MVVYTPASQSTMEAELVIPLDLMYTVKQRKQIPLHIVNMKCAIYFPISGPIRVRNVPPLIAVSGDNAVLNCPIYGYPWEAVQWEQGVQLRKFT